MNSCQVPEDYVIMFVKITLCNMCSIKHVSDVKHFKLLFLNFYNDQGRQIVTVLNNHSTIIVLVKKIIGNNTILYHGKKY